MKSTAELIAAHQLSDSEYQKIVGLLGREPSLTELGIFSVMWSEHCSYKSTRVHLKTLPTSGKHVLQGPGENAGIVDIGDGFAVAFKIESHNHPSFIEPFQGAATGVGGILRDIFTMGARPLAVLDSLRFGRVDGDHEAAARNRRILEGVVSGIAHYGNCFGVPTVGGECTFESCYDGNPLVNVLALGVFRRDEIFYARASGIGNPVIYVGAKTGRDGIHGASMASAEFTEESKQKRPNVQVGDPFMEKLLLEACLEAMKTGAVVGIQDMGAAGLTSSSSEMGSRAGTGIEIDIDKVPQREDGMTPYEVMLSESQERMLLVADRGREGEVFQVFTKWGLDAARIGTVTADGMLRVKKGGQTVAEIPTHALAEEAPRYHRRSTKPLRKAPLDGPEVHSADLKADLETLLASGDICSKRWIWEQYDHQVRTNTVAGPGYDAAVIRVKETDTSVAISVDGNGRYCLLDPREGTKLMVAECCRNLSVVGALPIATTNNLNFGNPERPEIMGQIVESIQGLAEACEFFEVPVTGGNVSLYNETLGKPIYPTPVVAIVGLLKTHQPVPPTFQQSGVAIVLLGGLGSPNARELGSTQYAKVVSGALWGTPPKLDMAYEKRLQAAIRELVRGRIVESAHDVSDGGLAIALAESSFGAAGIGADVRLDSSLTPELLLFHEGPSRVLVSTTVPERIIEVAEKNAIEAVQIGITLDSRVTIRNRENLLIDAPVAGLRSMWEGALEHLLREPVLV